MSYFPFFIQLEGCSGLIVGGGEIALRKVLHLMSFGAQLTVVAPSIIPELGCIPHLELLCREFCQEDLQGKTFVIAATDNRELNHYIAECCQRQRILVNVVDDREACGFLFPALIHDGDLSIGISTGGSSPTAAAYLKNQIQGILPENMKELLASLNELRERIKTEIPLDAARRARIFSDLFAVCLQTGRPPQEQEIQAILRAEDIKT